jgi:hypothetical protein
MFNRQDAKFAKRGLKILEENHSQDSELVPSQCFSWRTWRLGGEKKVLS